jgi:phosphatidylserine/phosphatidylglycerophosphate/cardiolipin synthase-like enzyme
MKIKEGIYWGVIFVLLVFCARVYYTYSYAPAQEIRVYYNHDTQENKQIINLIQNADKFVYFAVYTFTKTDIADALLGAKHRGLAVAGVTDKNQLGSLASQQKIIKELSDAGVPIVTQDHSAIMHMKAVVTDKGYASGSYNWTAAATDSNDEVLEIGSDEIVRKQYETILRRVFQKYNY